MGNCPGRPGGVRALARAAPRGRCGAATALTTATATPSWRCWPVCRRIRSSTASWSAGDRPGVPTLGDILRRHQLVHPGPDARASRNFPVAYMVFDLLRLRGRSLLAEPLHTRRALP